MANGGPSLDQSLAEMIGALQLDDGDQETKFLKWFWTGSNGNDLILKLNARPEKERDEKSIRLEKDPPVIYALVLNDGEFPFKHKGEQWKLCKVGFTHRSIQDDKNRMEEVKKQIISKYKYQEEPGAEPSELFALPIGAIDTTPFRETEKRIREKVGKPVLKEKANDIGLPVPTEWILTTKTRIKEIKRKVKNKTKEGEEAINVFSDNLNPDEKLSEVPDPPEDHKEDWCG